MSYKVTKIERPGTKSKIIDIKDIPAGKMMVDGPHPACVYVSHGDGTWSILGHTGNYRGRAGGFTEVLAPGTKVTIEVEAE